MHKTTIKMNDPRGNRTPNLRVWNPTRCHRTMKSFLVCSQPLLLCIIIQKNYFRQRNLIVRLTRSFGPPRFSVVLHFVTPYHPQTASHYSRFQIYWVLPALRLVKACSCCCCCCCQSCSVSSPRKTMAYKNVPGYTHHPASRCASCSINTFPFERHW